MRRITITIPPEILAGAEAEAARQGVSVSAFLSQAAERAVRVADGLAAAAEVFDEIGWPTAEEFAEVDRVLDRAVARQRTTVPTRDVA